MAIRALFKTKFQKLGISDLQTAQGATLKGETLALSAPNLETTFKPTVPIPEVVLPMRWDGRDRKGVLQQKSHGFWVIHQSFPTSAPGHILTTQSWPSLRLNSMRNSGIEIVSGLLFGLCLHSMSVFEFCMPAQSLTKKGASLYWLTLWINEQMRWICEWILGRVSVYMEGRMDKWIDGLVSGGVDDVWTSGVSFLQIFMDRNHSSCHDFQWQVN